MNEYRANPNYRRVNHAFPDFLSPAFLILKEK